MFHDLLLNKQLVHREGEMNLVDQQCNEAKGREFFRYAMYQCKWKEFNR
jgi:hypothetical protein